MAKKFKVSWCDLQEYYTFIEANTEEEALEKFHEDGVDSCEPGDFCQTEEDSIEVEECDE